MGGLCQEQGRAGELIVSGMKMGRAAGNGRPFRLTSAVLLELERRRLELAGRFVQQVQHAVGDREEGPAQPQLSIRFLAPDAGKSAQIGKTYPYPGQFHRPFRIAPVRAGIADLLLRRLDGVMKIRDSKLLLFQAPRAVLSQLMQLLPDAEPPTVMSLDGGGVDANGNGTGDVALQALCHGAMTWQRLEDLKRAGARGLMVLPVERMLA